jgi:transcriptional regulator
MDCNTPEAGGTKISYGQHIISTRSSFVYTPSHNRVIDTAEIQSFVRDSPFAILTSQSGDGLIASHLPLIYEPDYGQHGRLIGHMARANSQWRSISGETLAVFAGVHTYISSSWYEDNDAVPTWNYIAVHMYGRHRLIDSTDEAMNALRALTAHMEPSLLELWKDKSTYDSLVTQSRGIVAFEIDVTRIDAKWKMSQNRTPADQQRVVDALRRERTDDDSLAIATMIEKRLISTHG